MAETSLGNPVYPTPGKAGCHLADVLTRFRTALPGWRELLERSFLSPAMKQNFLRTIDERSRRVLL